jgi:hypothetical protein
VFNTLDSTEPGGDLEIECVIQKRKESIVIGRLHVTRTALRAGKGLQVSGDQQT